MVRIISSVALLLIALTTYSQRKKIEPISVVIIKPREVKYDSRYQKDIDRRSAKITYEINNPIISIDYAPGKKEPTIIRRTSKFKIDVDYFSYAAFEAQSFLELVCMGLDKPCPIVVKELRKEEKNPNLQQFAEEEKKQYVLDIHKIEILEKAGKFHASISVSFYNSTTKRFLIDSIFTGEEKEDLNVNLEGLPLECDNPMDCAYFNALSKIIDQLICSLNCGWITDDISLEEKRKRILINEYYPKKFDKNILKGIISPLDSNMNIEIAYQALFSPDSSKFIAFFLEQVTDTSVLKKMYFTEGDYTNNLVTHSYAIAGVKYDNEWYFRGLYYGNLTSYLDSTIELRKQSTFNMLQTYVYGFFKGETVEPDLQFWNTKLFAIVGDTQDRNKSNFLTKADELNYQPYEGLYLIVAKKLRERKQTEEEGIRMKLIDQYINPLVNKLKLTPQYEGRRLIYPSGMKTILVPIVENRPNNQVSTRYFVLLSEEKGDYKVYEWTYYDASRLRKYTWGGYYDEDLKKLTNWDHGFDYLNDENFWSQFVLAKKNAEFKYLKEIK